jgi:hypothetical protein
MGDSSSQNRGYEESVRFPRQGWWAEEFLRDAVAKAVVEKKRVKARITVKNRDG